MQDSVSFTAVQTPLPLITTQRTFNRIRQIRAQKVVSDVGRATAQRREQTDDGRDASVALAVCTASHSVERLISFCFTFYILSIIIGNDP